MKFGGGVFLKLDGDAALVDELASALYGIGIYIAEHFKTIGGFAYKSAERHGDRKTDHAGSGNTHAHCILKHVAAQCHFDP